MTDGEAQLTGVTLAHEYVLALMLREPGRDVRPYIKQRADEAGLEPFLAKFGNLFTSEQRGIVAKAYYAVLEALLATTE